ncbi:MAG: adenylate/guanylate cyclase domain-containing protein [Verrucomicrobia subdivision 3 bacterium]|nr:adenylate/guanylate cyclase domain-containing protein [Limisphaerales bacterium]
MAAVVGAALAALSGLCLHVFTFGGGLINLSYDLLTVANTPKTTPDDAILVVMDEDSHQKLQQPLNAPWDRSLHAKLVDKLTAAGAKAIVFDIVFSDPFPTNPESDRDLGRAFAASKRVIIAADHVRFSETGKRFDMPIDVLRDSARDVGSAEVVPSRDLVIRTHTPPEDLPSLSEAVASLAGVRMDSLPGMRWLNYYGPANSLPSLRYDEASQTDADELFRGKFVFVGARVFTRFAGDRKDEYRTPHSFWADKRQFIPGVEIQATAFLNLLRGDWLLRLPVGQERALILIFGAVAGAILMLARPWTATWLAVLLVALAAASSFVFLKSTRIWFPWLIPVSQVTLALAVSVVVNSFRLYLERRLYEQTLALYLSPKLVKKFSQDERFRQPGAEKQMLTILFSDIANFTTISEGMDSDDLAKLMNKYFQRAVSECIHVTDGTVVKYIGDAIFAFWNAPDQQHDHAVRACEAALRFRDQDVEYVNGQPLFTRIGLHTGVANVGNFGSVQRVDYTALGESINLASRMEGLNKYLGTTVLVTGATQAEIGGRFTTRFLGKFRLKGFEKSVDVFELLGREGDAIEAWHKHFSSALESFRNRDFNSAAHEFRRVLELRKEDGPSKFYLHKIEELRAADLPAHWHGEVELKEK